MGLCRFCGRSAGWFRSSHLRCRRAERARERAEAAARLAAANEARDRLSDAILRGDASTALSESGAPTSRVLVVEALERAIWKAVSAGSVSRDVERNVLAAVNAHGLRPHDLPSWPALVRGLVLHDLEEGRLPARIEVSGRLPIVLEKSDQLVWITHGVTLHEPRTRTQYVGGSHGVSIRIMRGVSYRVGRFRGEPVRTTTVQLVDEGRLFLTRKYLYFDGHRKNFRIPYRKMVSVELFSNGLEVQRDAMTAKPQTFEIANENDGFTGRLVHGLAHLAADG